MITLSRKELEHLNATTNTQETMMNNEVMPAKKPKRLMPLNGHIIFAKDEDKKTTKGGLVLPETAKIPVLTGKVVEIAKDIRDNINFLYLRKFDTVIISYSGAVPVELDPANKLFCVPASSILGVWKDPEDCPDDDDD